MASGNDLPQYAKAYVIAVISLGLLVIGESLNEIFKTPISSEWLVLAFFTLISGSASVTLPGANVSISISEAFVFTAVFLYGPAAGTLTVALDGLVMSFWLARRRPEFLRALFNIAAPALSAWASSRLFFRVASIAPLSLGTTMPNSVLPALIIFALTYFLLNTSLIALVIGMQKRISPVAIWCDDFAWLSLNYLCGAFVAVLLVGYHRTVDLRFVAVIVPLLLVLYFTFKFSMDRVRDAEQHLHEVDRLHLSTIETLALAIDAKDQVTHGHIRRVQTLAVKLSRELGMADDLQLRAVAAAALLHDMGKIAVPEHILNKPGRLTAQEFERMKLHATIGAEILAAIEFPYPIVPIVRHHHENWDGSGYPAGLKGTDIPLGARILSVVDCFDALTSDRPYRRGLSDNEAVQVLTERRGTMYDPMIVDRFIQMNHRYETRRASNKLARHTLENIAASRAHSEYRVLPEHHGLQRDRRNHSKRAASVAVGYEVVALINRLAVLLSSQLLVFYAIDDETGELVAALAIGDLSEHVLGVRIAVGKSLSGWVAASRQPIVNSDPALDLSFEEHGGSTLRSCLSVPVVRNGQLVGVVSYYSERQEAFTALQCQSVEATIAQAFMPYHMAV